MADRSMTGKVLIAVAAVVAVCLLMGGALYGVWVFTDAGTNAALMRLITTGMLIFNQLFIMAMVVWVIVRLHKTEQH